MEKREIKFRAWNTIVNRMFWFDVMNGNAHGTGSGYISMAPFGEDITKVRFKDNLFDVDPTDCQLMQFTGLKDKNGKEVFESDIVKSFHFSEGKKQHFLFHKIMWSEEFHCWYACNINNADGESIRANGNPQLWVYAKSDFEIVGNVFETPELLK